MNQGLGMLRKFRIKLSARRENILFSDCPNPATWPSNRWMPGKGWRGSIPVNEKKMITAKTRRMAHKKIFATFMTHTSVEGGNLFPLSLIISLYFT